MQNRDIQPTTTLTLFFKANFFVTTLFFLLFLIFNHDTGTLLFTIPAAVSTSAMLYLVYFLLLRPLFRFKKVMLPLLVILFTLTNFALLLDFFIFRIWKFHINGMVLNILMSPAAFDSIQTGTAPVLITIGYFVAFVAFELRLLRFLKGKEVSLLKGWNRKFNRVVAPVVLLVALTEKVYYGFANMYAEDKILESTKPIPLYQPLTFTRFMEKRFGLHAAERKNADVGVKRDAKVNYPLKPIEIPHPKPVHIFIFASDAVRNDILNAAVTPNILRFSRDAIWFTDNRSGGNTTRFGIFSLFYGLNSAYWFIFLNAKSGPVFFKTLKRLDYDIGIFSSTDTSWPEFKQTVYYDVKENIHDRFPGLPWEKDTSLTEAWLKWIDDKNGSQPIFSFIFLDGPHGSSYPKSFAKFQPDGAGEVNYATASEEDRTELFNQYKNAVHYSDHLIGKMIDKLKAKGLYENAIVIFTSDHGQEYYEFGLLGHNSAFNIEQTNSPLIIKIPGLASQKIDTLTSSIDLMPTLMRKIGVTNDFADFSNGKDLLADDYRRDFATCGNWYKNAIITPKYTLVFSNLPNEILKTRVFHTKTYKPIPYPDDPNVNRYILEVLNQNRRFVK